MSEETIARRYARALFEIAEEKNKFEQFEQDLTALNEAIQSSKELESFLVHPRIDVKVKKEKINAIFAGNISEEVLSLMQLLLDRRRENIISALMKEFVALSNDARNVMDAVVYTAQSMDEAELQAIAEKFGKKIGKTIRVKNEVDPSIVGGLIIRIGDRLYDGSVKGKLFRFKQSLVHS